MRLQELSDEELVELLRERRNLDYISDRMRTLMATHNNLPIEKVGLLQEVAFGWEIADVLAERMQCYKRIGGDSTIGNLQ